VAEEQQGQEQNMSMIQQKDKASHMRTQLFSVGDTVHLLRDDSFTQG
jgi:hypothetical protein